MSLIGKIISPPEASVEDAELLDAFSRLLGFFQEIELHP